MNKEQPCFYLITLLLFLVLTMTLMSSCSKRNSEVVELSNRVVSQLEYFRGTLNSTGNFSYKDDRIVFRDYQVDKSHFMYDFEYSENQVITFVSRKIEEYWLEESSRVYNYQSNQLKEVVYREFQNDEWTDYEKWSFTYNGTLYDEILMEEKAAGDYVPVTKLKYTYNADTLLYYNVYNYSGEWNLIREVKFEYFDGKLDKTTLFYAPVGLEYGLQEQHTYQYSEGYNTRVVLSVKVDSGWYDRNEILRNYNVSGKMIDETVKAIGDPNYNYRYEYTYELGKENLDQFPFYDQPLYEFIYPTLVSQKSSEITGIKNIESFLKQEFLPRNY